MDLLFYQTSSTRLGISDFRSNCVRLPPNETNLGLAIRFQYILSPKFAIPKPGRLLIFCVFWIGPRFVFMNI